MLDPHVPSDAPAATAELLDIRGRTALEALRLDAGAIHRRLRRIADQTASGNVPEVEDLDRVAESVAALHRRILDVSRYDGSQSLADVVAARQSIHRSLAIVQEVADEVLAS